MKLIIPLSIWQRIQGYVIAAAPYEITGIGTIQQIGDNFVVDEIFVPSQKSSTSFCEADEGAINEIIFDLIKYNNLARAKTLRFRWHSHVDGAVYWSPTDEYDITAWRAPWVVNLVTNIRGEKVARLDVSTDEIHLRNVTLDVHIQIPELAIPDEVQLACNLEVEQKISSFSPREIKKMQYEIAVATIGQSSAKGGDMNESKS